MHKIFRAGNDYFLKVLNEGDVFDTLPPNTYSIKYIELRDEYYLEKVDGFAIPEKLYGTTEKDAARIMDTFISRGISTGVLLSGEKGSGKTLLSKVICNIAVSNGIPVIIVNDQFCGETFNTFISNISQPCVVLFDEFEKVYDRESQERILTLLDGSHNSNKLFLFTCNDYHRIDDHMVNRPGRIYYRLDYTGLEESFIREYCEDTLNNKLHIDKIVQLAGLFKAFNFDMLKAIVEECNRYDETPETVLHYLNIDIHSSNTQYAVDIIDNKGDVITKAPAIIAAHPMSFNGVISEWCELITDSDKDGDDDIDIRAVFKPSEDFIEHDKVSNSFIFSIKGHPNLRAKVYKLRQSKNSMTDYWAF